LMDQTYLQYYYDIGSGDPGGSHPK
jgi:hypothetical protein